MIWRGDYIAQGRDAMTGRVLVLDGDSAAAVEAVQSLGRAGAVVDLCAQDECIAFRSNYVTGRYRQVDPVQAEAFSAWVRALDERADYDLAIASTERTLRAFRRLALNDPIRVKAVLASDESLDVALDKQRTWKLARDLGIPVPECDLIESLERLPPVARYPIVLKPTSSLLRAGNQFVPGDVALIEHPERRLEFLRTYLPYGPVQQQAYVPGHGFGIEFLYSHGRLAWYFAHERIHEGPRRGGASSYRRSIEPPDKLFGAAKRLMDALRWHGIAMIEFRVQDDGQFHLMEINPRLWGSLALAIDAGLDFPVGLLRIARGETLPPQPRYRTHYYARRILEDIHWQWANLKADHSDPMLLTRPRLASLLGHLRPLLGRESWDHFDWRDLPVTRAILRKALVHGREAIGRRWERRRLAKRIVREHASHCGPGREPAKRIESILILCHGNICRSPFAAGLSHQKLSEYHIESAGFAGPEGRRTPNDIRELARSKGIDLSHHVSTRITREQVDRADLIVVMDLDNYEMLAREWPDALRRTTMLGLFGSPPVLSISDPYGLPRGDAAQVFETVRAAVDGLAGWLGGTNASTLKCPAPETR
jgi:protein-tyrosine-phosphatase/predicted ATP-grasp superfamily ATP-dependent carboligase